jgi:hypothetical protein
MADQFSQNLMIGQRNRATNTSRDPPAIGAEEGGRKAAPVNEEENLLMGCKPLLDGGEERLCEKRPNPLLLLTKINHMNGWEGPGIDSPWEVEMAIFSDLAVVERLKRGGGGTQYHDGIRLPSADKGHIPRVIVNPLFLLVRGIMFLIDDDDPQVRKGGEDGRPNPNRQERLPLLDPAPLVVTLPC